MKEFSMSQGTFFVVATPLGNAEDLSPRARQCMEDVDFVLAEDTRRARLALSRWSVKVKTMFSLHDHNEEQKTSGIIELLLEGKNIALISDAGMPVLADPGYLLVRACHEASINVRVIPGPCAPVTALAGSGIAPQPFTFFGFLPRKKSDKEKTLAPFANCQTSLIFFERKDRIERSLKDLYPLLGRRQVCIARELTKTHEEYIHFFLDQIPNLNLLGEISVIIGPPLEQKKTDKEQIIALIGEELPKGGTARDVAKRVQAQCTGWTSSDIYAMISQQKK